jgi:tetratricopeptide (TPR) repeat protein
MKTYPKPSWLAVFVLSASLCWVNGDLWAQGGSNRPGGGRPGGGRPGGGRPSGGNPERPRPSGEFRGGDQRGGQPNRAAPDTRGNQYRNPTERRPDDARRFEDTRRFEEARRAEEARRSQINRDGSVRTGERPSWTRSNPAVRGQANVSPRQPVVVNRIDLGSRSVYLGGRNYNPSYRNYDWYNGFWNPQRANRFGYGSYGYGGYGGYGGGYGGYGYGGNALNSLVGTALGYPPGWGLGGWGLGRAYYSSGYLPYANPYYSGLATNVYDYSRPVQVAVRGASSATEEAQQNFESARQQFADGNYGSSLELVNQAIANSSDPVMHEFRALVLFAQGDYDAAAATLHSVLSVGPGWDWPTLARLYPDIDVYTRHLRALEAAVRSNPDRPAPRLVLAYHYLTAGHEEPAQKQLRELTRLEPSDRLAADLLRMVQADDTAKASSEATGPQDRPKGAEPSAPAIDPNALAGTWQASREDGSKFDLTLSSDSHFVWTFSQGDRKEELSGEYSTEGNLLILEPEDSGTMIGKVQLDGNEKFNFRVVGAPPEDKGLVFKR